MYSHFLVHEDNKDTRKKVTNSVYKTHITLFFQTFQTLFFSRINTFLTSFKRVKTDIYNSYIKLFLL